MNFSPPNISAIRHLVELRREARWCLFLDRDGVINRRIDGDYVRGPHQFSFLPGALDALAVLAQWAPAIVVVTNQQGIGKGLMRPTDLLAIHAHMRSAVRRTGGRIDAVLACPHLASSHCGCRKPQPGLPLSWLAHQPDLDPALSLVVGDSTSDMELAAAMAERTGRCDSIRIDATTSGPPTAHATTQPSSAVRSPSVRAASVQSPSVQSLSVQSRTGPLTSLPSSGSASASFQHTPTVASLRALADHIAAFHAPTSANHRFATAQNGRP